LLGNPWGYPAGNYTLLSEGQGRLELHFDSGNQWLTSPCNHTVSLPAEVQDAGVNLVITESNISDHVRNIRFVMPGHAADFDTAPFVPFFVQEMQIFRVLRFMDWSRTNDNNLATWEQRNRPGLPDRQGLTSLSASIASITHFTQGSVFSGSYTALVTLTSSDTLPGLVTGHSVAISGTDAVVFWADDESGSGSRDLNLEEWEGMIEVLSPTSFLVNVRQYWWSATARVTTFTPGTRGTVTLSLRKGTPLETMLDLAAEAPRSHPLNLFGSLSLSLSASLYIFVCPV
jgi:hypothetical protein